jgi:exosortase/archaeosortase family protein
MVVRRPLADTLVIVASAPPIAVAVTVIRITVTGLLYATVGGWWADVVFHDLAGWLMMPLALALLGLELAFLSHLFVEAGEKPAGPKRGDRSRAPWRPAPAATPGP